MALKSNGKKGREKNGKIVSVQPASNRLPAYNLTEKTIPLYLKILESEDAKEYFNGNGMTPERLRLRIEELIKVHSENFVLLDLNRMDRISGKLKWENNAQREIYILKQVVRIYDERASRPKYKQ